MLFLSVYLFLAFYLPYIHLFCIVAFECLGLGTGLMDSCRKAAKMMGKSAVWAAPAAAAGENFRTRLGTAESAHPAVAGGSALNSSHLILGQSEREVGNGDT